MNKFSFTSKIVPSKNRSTVVTTSVSVGVPTTSASQIIQNITNNNYYGEGERNIMRGRISIIALLALKADEIRDGDQYLVYNSYSDATGWSENQSYTLYGETYQDGTAFQRIGDVWKQIDNSMIDMSGVVKMSELPRQIFFIESVNNSTSYDNLYGQERNGMIIAKVGCYQLDADTYKPVFSEKGEAGQPYYTKNYTKSIYVPIARYYDQGDERVYEGGVLSADDYQKLIESGGSAPSNMVTTDTTQTITGAKTFANQQWETAITFKSGAGKTRTLLNFVDGSGDTLGYIGIDADGDPIIVDADAKNTSVIARKSDIPTKVSELTNDKGYLTEHQSLVDYAKKSDIPDSITSDDVEGWGFIKTNGDKIRFYKNQTGSTVYNQFIKGSGIAKSVNYSQSDISTINVRIANSIDETNGILSEYMVVAVFTYVDSTNYRQQKMATMETKQIGPYIYISLDANMDEAVVPAYGRDAYWMINFVKI